MIELSISERLEYLREQIHAQCISYGEIAELESLREHIPPDDAELHEWAGTPESEFRTMNDEREGGLSMPAYIIAQCACCDRVALGAPGAGGATHLCKECSAETVMPTQIYAREV